MALDTFRATLVGSPLMALFAQKYAYAGQAIPGVGSLLLQIAADRWTKFGIDAGHFYWLELAALEHIPMNTIFGMSAEASLGLGGGSTPSRGGIFPMAGYYASGLLTPVSSFL